jgi:hypothetical protein
VPTLPVKPRHVVYRSCGGVIVACCLLTFAYYQLELAWETRWIKPVLLLETVALWAFGVSWFVKGEVVLRDIQGPMLAAKPRETTAEFAVPPCKLTINTSKVAFDRANFTTASCRKRVQPASIGILVGCE